MKIKQTYIAQISGLHVSTISNIINGVRRPSWRSAKILAKATQTDPELWLEGSSEEIRAALSTYKEGGDHDPRHPENI